MATSFPTTLDQLINPSGTDSVQLVSHAAQHTNANDAIKALETKIGVDNSSVTTTLDYKVRDLISKIYTNEMAQDAIAAALAAGTHYNITVDYNDAANSLSLTSTYGDEQVMDAIANALTEGTGILKTYNDAANTITISVDTSLIATKLYVDQAISTLGNTASNTYVPQSDVAQPDGVASLDASGFVPQSQLDINERIQDQAAKLITDGTHTRISVVYDDANNKLNLTATYADEEVMDAIAASLTAGNGITKTYDDPANKINISVDTTVIADRAYVNQKIADLIASAPGVLDTLKEIADAIGNDANFATTITNALATKLNITDAANTYVPLSGNDERIQDAAAALFTHTNHSNVTATYDDANNRINLAVTAQLTQEQAQDYIAPLFTHGLNPNITASYDDENNHLILETIIPPSKAILSTSAPANPLDGEFWLDTDEFRTGTTKALKVWQASTNSWQYVASDLSLSTTNTWTSKNTFTNGIIIGLGSPPDSPEHGQIYYNTVIDKLKVWDGQLWQDIQGGGGGGLSLTATDETAPPSTFFVGLIAPPSGATSNGDLWIDVDDIDTPFNQFYTGGVAPDPQQYEFWVDNVEPIQELIYSANEPGTPSYTGELWIDTDDYDGSILEFGTTAPNPDNVQLWVDLNENETPSYYKDLTFTNYATIADFPSSASNGYIAVDASSNTAYVRVTGNWLALVTPNNINTIINSTSSTFQDIQALAWMGFE
jgi:hypothetical protein